MSGPLLDRIDLQIEVQMITLLRFLTFYIPRISTFAVMHKTIGRRDALYSVLLSVGVALVVSGAVRALLEGARWFAV
jgi:ferrous iron transport protein B